MDNPRYYSHITIDKESLAAYPEDDVPAEVQDLIRHTTDTGLVDKENLGYMPDEDNEDYCKLIYRLTKYVSLTYAFSN